MRYKIPNLMVQTDLTGSDTILQGKHLKILHASLVSIENLPWHTEPPTLLMLQACLVQFFINVVSMPGPQFY